MEYIWNLFGIYMEDFPPAKHPCGRKTFYFRKVNINVIVQNVLKVRNKEIE